MRRNVPLAWRKMLSRPKEQVTSEDQQADLGLRAVLAASQHGCGPRVPKSKGLSSAQSLLSLEGDPELHKSKGARIP